MTSYLITGLIAAALSVDAAASTFERLESLYRGGTLPDLVEYSKNQVWGGICAASPQPDLPFRVVLPIYSTHDPLFGNHAHAPVMRYGETKEWNVAQWIEAARRDRHARHATPLARDSARNALTSWIYRDSPHHSEHSRHLRQAKLDDGRRVLVAQEVCRDDGEFPCHYKGKILWKTGDVQYYCYFYEVRHE